MQHSTVSLLKGFLGADEKYLLSTRRSTCAVRGSYPLSEIHAQTPALSLEPDDNEKGADFDDADAGETDAGDDNADEIWLPQCAESQEVPFLAFVFLSCAS